MLFARGIVRLGLSLAGLLILARPGVAEEGYRGVRTIDCSSLELIDGDSVRCDGVNMRALGHGEPDVLGYDTPEVRGRAKCKAERMLAHLADQRAAELISHPNVVVRDSGKADNYNRPLVWVYVSGDLTLGEVLLAEGYAIEWRPGKSANWCTKD